jgi:hypothetical protein
VDIAVFDIEVGYIDPGPGRVIRALNRDSKPVTPIPLVTVSAWTSARKAPLRR